MADHLSSPDVQAYRLMRAGRFADALCFAEQAIAGTRACVPAHGMLATILMRLGRAREADLVVSQALDYAAGSADAYDSLAHALMLLGRHVCANLLYRRVVEICPADPRFWYNLASSERSLGRLAEAETACDRAIGLDKKHYPSYLLRSELRIQTPDANHVSELQGLARSAVEDRARLFLAYALGKELDDLQQFDEAFRWFHEAATTRKRHLEYDVAIDERKLQRIAEVFPSEPARKDSHRGNSNRFIFIVGLPRSGTTLLERILSGLPNVRSNGETDNFARALISASTAEGGDIFMRAGLADPAKIGVNYEKLAGGEDTHVTIVEKLPMNYLYLGAIHRALPRARLLIVGRSPLDSCFAMYRTLFGEAYPFSYDFEDLARYYAAYERLMRHWNSSFGAAICDVRYEDLVKDPLRVGASIAHECALTWVASAVEVHKNAAASLTASASQIRRPIYGSSSGRWRHYRAHLDPLIRALRQYGVTLPNDA